MKINKKKVTDWFVFIVLISLVIVTKPDLISNAPLHEFLKFF